MYSREIEQAFANQRSRRTREPAGASGDRVSPASASRRPIRSLPLS